MSNTGRFITFESIDGLGKTTQVDMLQDRMLSDGLRVYRTKEPGDAVHGSGVGRGVRHLVFNDPTTLNMVPGVADLLFLADHIQNSHDVQQHLNLGEIVICDRYADSQFAYSASSSKKTPAWTNALFGEHYGTQPDLTFLLMARGPGSPMDKEDISWALGRARARAGAEAGKQAGKLWDSVEEQRVIQEAYLDDLCRFHHVRVINVWETSSRDDVARQVWMHVKEHFADLYPLVEAA